MFYPQIFHLSLHRMIQKLLLFCSSPAAVVLTSSVSDMKGLLRSSGDICHSGRKIIAR